MALFPSRTPSRGAEHPCCPTTFGLTQNFIHFCRFGAGPVRILGCIYVVKLKPTLISTMELRISEPTSWIKHWFLLLCHNVNIFGINNVLIDLHPVVPKESASAFPTPLRSARCPRCPSCPAGREGVVRASARLPSSQLQPCRVPPHPALCRKTQMGSTFSRGIFLQVFLMQHIHVWCFWCQLPEHTGQRSEKGKGWAPPGPVFTATAELLLLADVCIQHGSGLPKADYFQKAQQKAAVCLPPLHGESYRGQHHQHSAAELGEAEHCPSSNPNNAVPLFFFLHSNTALKHCSDPSKTNCTQNHRSKESDHGHSYASMWLFQFKTCKN